MGLEHLERSEAPLPLPSPGPGQILVRVEAASLNYRDLLIARNTYRWAAPLPFVPPLFDVQQNWHVRSHDEPRMRWLRAEIATLFNDQTDPWKAMEVELYGPRASRRRAVTGRTLPVR